MKMLGRWRFIDAAEVIQIQQKIMAAFGQESSPPAPNCIESCVDNAINAALYSADNEPEPDLLVSVAYLLFYITKNHCFLDGNKRAAWASAVHVFFINGLAMNSGQVEAADLVNGVAENRYPFEHLLRWLHHPTRFLANSIKL